MCEYCGCQEIAPMAAVELTQGHGHPHDHALTHRAGGALQ
jgi:hypothetical protein